MICSVGFMLYWTLWVELSSNHAHTHPLKIYMCITGQSNQIKSNQFYLYSPKSQSHCLSVLYNLYSEQHPLSLDPRFEWGKTSHVDGEKKKTMEETSVRAWLLITCVTEHTVMETDDYHPFSFSKGKVYPLISFLLWWSHSQQVSQWIKTSCPDLITSTSPHHTSD